MTDLKIIDELLCVLRSDRNLTWGELEADSYTARQALIRLRRVWHEEKMPAITLSLANYFKETQS